MKEPRLSDGTNANLRRSPRLASKRRASMSTIDDINQLFEVTERRRNSAKKLKPNVKLSARKHAVGKRSTEAIRSDDKVIKEEVEAPEFKRPQLRAKRRNNDFGLPKLKRKISKIGKAPIPLTPRRSRSNSRLNDSSLDASVIEDVSCHSRASGQLDNLELDSSYLDDTLNQSTVSLDMSPSSSKKSSRKRKVNDDDSMFCDDLEDDVDFPGLHRTRSSATLKRWKEDEDLSNVTLTGYRTFKRPPRYDDDNISIQSYTMGYSSRRNRNLVRVSSLANLISPVSSVKKVGQALQRSMSFRSSHSPSIYIKPYSKPAATPTKRRDSKLWSQTVTNNINEGLTKIEIKRQEAIYELFQGESDLVEDLQLILKTYRDSMKSLGILNQQELSTIFFRLEELVPLHEELIERLESSKQEDGRTDAIGKDILEWLPQLTESYTAYCINQLAAKALLDAKKQDRRVQDFLERCQESPFSRKLDLWNFLDVPRSRLVKYPLLLRNILRLTAAEHEDKRFLNEAIEQCERIITEVDKGTGEHKCQYYISQLEYLDENQRHPLIADQKSLHCMGILRNNKGSKLHTFLFEDILVVTRPATRNGVKSFQVTRQPIPVRSLNLEQIAEGEVKSGSFRGAFSSGSGKHAFKVTSTDPEIVQSFTFVTTDEHDKKQWMQMIRNAISLTKEKSAPAGD